MSPYHDISLILMDIEGTISDIHFVKDVLFPYSAKELRNFVANNKVNPGVRQCLKDTGAADDEGAIAQLLTWIKEDNKHPALKTLQGLIWKKGFTESVFKAHLYPEVVEQWKTWRAAGLRLGIYSSGSIDAQKLFFKYSIEGNVLNFLEAHFDLSAGPKKESRSYAKIADKLGLHNSKILFLSDVEAELDAAREARMQTGLLVRDGASASESKHPAFKTLNEIRIAVNEEKP